MSRTVNINEEFVVVSEGKKDTGKFAILGNDGKFDPSVIPSMDGTVSNDQFAASLASQGYQKLPSGLVLQWGNETYQATAGATGTLITFPTPFVTECYQILATDVGAGVHVVSTLPVSNTQFRVWGMHQGAYADTGFRYLAIGK